jgi:hypothetical protein
MDKVTGGPSGAWSALNARATVVHDNTLDPLPVVDRPLPSPSDRQTPEQVPREPPGEAERRRVLVEALAAREAAQRALAADHEAHERALRNQTRARTAVSRFIDLDGRIEDHTTTALREGGSGELTPELRQHLHEREVANTEADHADRAVQTFLHELSRATERHKRAETAVTKAAHEVIEVGRDAVRDAARRLDDKLQAHRQVVHRPDEAAPWRRVRDALLADPLGADLSVTVPDVPEEEPPPAPAVMPFIIGDGRVKLAKRVGEEHLPDRYLEPGASLVQPDARPFAVRAAEAAARTGGAAEPAIMLPTNPG